MVKQRAGRRPVVGLAGVTAATLLLAAGAAGAHDPAQHGATVAKKNTAQKQVQQPAARVMPGLSIARDAETGALRAPTDAEAAALSMPAPAEPTVIIEFVTESGAIAAAVPESYMTYTVVSKAADGSIDSICLPNKQAAESAVQTLARTAQPATARTSFSRTALRPAPGAPHE